MAQKRKAQFLKTSPEVVGKRIIIGGDEVSEDEFNIYKRLKALIEKQSNLDNLQSITNFVRSHVTSQKISNSLLSELFLHLKELVEFDDDEKFRDMLDDIRSPQTDRFISEVSLFLSISHHQQ